MEPRAAEDDLTPIEQVARQFGIRASAIRYYEDRGLITAASRRAGRRWYDPSQIRRLAIIRFWQTNGLMSLDDITQIVDGPADHQRWPDVLKQHTTAISQQIARLQQVQEFLTHIAEHHPDTAPDGCHHYEQLLRQNSSRPPETNTSSPSS